MIHRLPLILERGWKQESADLLGVAHEEAPALTLSSPRSRCPSCGHAIAWHENIPLASWLWLRARCSACKAPISPRYPLIELATAVLFALVGWRFGAEPVALLWCLFCAVLVALAGIDWDTTLLPDNLTLPLLWAGLVSAALGWTIGLSDSVWGAVVGYLSLWSVYWLFKLTTGKEGMGFGDFKLLAALGAWLGWMALPQIVLVSAIAGALVGLIATWRGTMRFEEPLPFGPFLAIGGVATLFFGTPLYALFG